MELSHIIPPKANVRAQFGSSFHRPSQLLKAIAVSLFGQPPVPALTTRRVQPGMFNQTLIAADTSSRTCGLGAPSGFTRTFTGCPLSGSNHRGGGDAGKK